MSQYKIFKTPGTFIYKGRKYKEFYSWYNTTWRGSREIEIPLGMFFLLSNKGRRVLEIGHVLKHYNKKLIHTVLDKYEKWPGVINEDLENFHPSQRYDCIVSISTLEHIGMEIKGDKKKKLLSCFRNMKAILNNNGKILFTIPIGFNKDLDYLILTKKIKIDSIIIMKKINNHWQEINRLPKELKYDDGYLLIGEIRK